MDSLLGPRTKRGSVHKIGSTILQVCHGDNRRADYHYLLKNICSQKKFQLRPLYLSFHSPLHLVFCLFLPLHGRKERRLTVKNSLSEMVVYPDDKIHIFPRPLSADFFWGSLPSSILIIVFSHSRTLRKWMYFVHLPSTLSPPLSFPPFLITHKSIN